MYQAFAVGLLSSEDILQFPSSFIDFTRSRCQDLRKWFFKNKNSVCCEHLSACKGVYRWNSVSVGHRGKIVAKAKPSKVCLSLLRMLTTIHISFIIDRGINDIHLQEMRYLSSNIHRWFLSTITVGAPGPEQCQSYRQSLSPHFYVKKFWRLICDFFISVSFHKDAEFICPRTCISYVQIISMTQSRKTTICQTQTT